MPQDQQHTIAGYWQDVATTTGAEFNFDFWKLCKPRRSTYPACRAVLAARQQDAEDEPGKQRQPELVRQVLLHQVVYEQRA